VDGFVKNDKVRDLAGGDAFDVAALHFGNGGGGRVEKAAVQLAASW
jgi:hypothetical protein